MSDPRLEYTRIFRAERQKVFEAWTDPELMSKWFVAHPDWRAEATANLEVGGAYEVKMHADTGEVFETHGVYREISPHDKLVFSWSSYLVEDSLVTLTFRDVDDGTEMRLVHEFLLNDEVKNRHDGGWQGCLASLERFLS